METSIKKTEKSKCKRKPSSLDFETVKNKFSNKGVDSLSEVELLSIILSSGGIEGSSLSLASEIMNFCNNRIDNLSRMSLSDLQKFRGVGEAKAKIIMSALELGRRRVFQKFTKSDAYKSSESIYELLKPELADKIYEEFWIVLLNNSYRLIRKVCISTGGLLGTIVDPRLVFKSAIEAAAVRIVLVHNHPSGDVLPSQNDIDLTKKIKEGAKYLDIKVMDHIIVSGISYFSFADENLVFSYPVF